MEKHNLGLVLSGGGAKCMAHLGVIKALQEAGIEAGCVAGTGAGAVAAALYADGCTAEEALTIFKKSQIFKFRGLNWSKPGLMDTEKYLGFIKEYFGDRKFEDLGKEVYVVATDLIHGKIRSFSEGPLAKPLQASCALPFLYSPVVIDGLFYSAGRAIDNFPVEQIKDRSEYILGSYAGHFKKVAKEDLKARRNVMDRVFQISNLYSSRTKMKWCNWVVNPPELNNFGTFTLSKMDEIFEIGYQYGKQVVPEIKSKIS